MGFNIEIKYPMGGDEMNVRPVEVNTYVDRILEDVATHGGERMILFSSFHPEVVRALKLKQVRRPPTLRSDCF